MEGCLLYLLVFYLDNLNFVFFTPRQTLLPRVAEYTSVFTSQLVSYDRERHTTNKAPEFGRTKVRPQEQVIYTRRGAACSSISRTPAKPVDRVTGDRKVSQSNSANQPNLEPLVGKKPKSNDGAHWCEPRQIETIEEYIEDFCSQIHRSKEELRLRIHSLLKNCTLDKEGEHDVHQIKDHHSGDHDPATKSTSKYYIVMNSSSSTPHNSCTSIQSAIGGDLDCGNASHTNTNPSSCSMITQYLLK